MLRIIVGVLFLVLGMVALAIGFQRNDSLVAGSSTGIMLLGLGLVFQ